MALRSPYRRMKTPVTHDAVLNALQRLIDALGFPPSYRELASECRLPVATTFRMVRELSKQGMVTIGEGQRCLVLNTPRARLEGRISVFFQGLKSGETPEVAADAAELHLETGRLLARELGELGG
jgi:hypothetical protein